MSSKGKKRVPIPSQLASQILFDSRHTCCICENLNKDVNIHHIDGNPSNNLPENLVVLCLDCHSRVSGSRGHGRSFSTEEVKKYKASWEERIRQTRASIHPMKGHEKELKAQIDVIVCEVLSYNRPFLAIGNSLRPQQLLGTLGYLQLWRGTDTIRQAVIEGLDYIMRLTPPDSGVYIEAIRVLKDIWQRFLWSSTQKDKPNSQLLELSIDALDRQDEFILGFASSDYSVKATISAAALFYKVGLLYLQRKNANRALHIIEKYITLCMETDKPWGHNGLLETEQVLRDLSEWTKTEQPEWKYQQIRIRKMYSKVSRYFKNKI